VGLGFHHFENPGLAAKRLAERLKVGGVLFIVDFLEHGHGHHHSNEGSGNHHSHSHENSEESNVKGKENQDENKEETDPQYSKAKNTVMHMGFTKEAIEKMFMEAGVGGSFGYVEVGGGIVFEGFGKGEPRRVFMARGTKV